MVHTTTAANHPRPLIWSCSLKFFRMNHTSVALRWRYYILFNKKKTSFPMCAHLCEERASHQSLCCFVITHISISCRCYKKGKKIRICFARYLLLAQQCAVSPLIVAGVIGPFLERFNASIVRKFLFCLFLHASYVNCVGPRSTVE